MSPLLGESHSDMGSRQPVDHSGSNCISHQSPVVKRSGTGNSPELNPMERLWACLRNQLLPQNAFDDSQHLLDGAVKA